MAEAAGRSEGGGGAPVAGDGSSSLPSGGSGGDGGEPSASRQLSESETTMTSVVGTHGFMAPEVGLCYAARYTYNVTAVGAL